MWTELTSWMVPPYLRFVKTWSSRSSSDTRAYAGLDACACQSFLLQATLLLQGRHHGIIDLSTFRSPASALSWLEVHYQDCESSKGTATALRLLSPRSACPTNATLPNTHLTVVCVVTGSWSMHRNYLGISCCIRASGTTSARFRWSCSPAGPYTKLASPTY